MLRFQNIRNAAAVLAWGFAGLALLGLVGAAFVLTEAWAQWRGDT